MHLFHHRHHHHDHRDGRFRDHRDHHGHPHHHHHGHPHHDHHHGHFRHGFEFGPRGHGHHPFGDWREERGEGRGRRRVFDSSDLRLVLLKLIADQPRHGYDLIRAIEELTAGNYVPSAGVVYPALSVLQDQGFIEGAESEGSRKAFSATAEGKAELNTNAVKVEELFARLAALAAPRGNADSAPVRRALGNLRAVLQARFEGNTEKDTWHAIADILDEAARKIERL